MKLFLLAVLCWSLTYAYIDVYGYVYNGIDRKMTLPYSHSMHTRAPIVYTISATCAGSVGGVPVASSLLVLTMTGDTR